MNKVHPVKCSEINMFQIRMAQMKVKSETKSDKYSTGAWNPFPVWLKVVNLENAIKYGDRGLNIQWTSTWDNLGKDRQQSHGQYHCSTHMFL